MAAGTGSSVGARSVGGARKGLGWLRWLLLLLLLVAAVVLLVALLGGDDGDDGGSSRSAAPQSAPAASPPASGGAAAGGSLTAEGQSLLGASTAVFGAAVGQEATGSGVEVLSVVQDEGFFVGTSDADRVYVELGGDVGEAERATTYAPAAGDRVDLTGEVRPAPQDPGRTLRLEAADAQVVERQGAFVNATEVTPSG